MIAQQDDYGCGVACVANLLGISYPRALSLFVNPQSVIDGKNCYARDIAAALRKAGLEAESKYIKSRLRRQIYKPRTIVFIQKSRRYPAGHYLLRTEAGWVDPWINLPEKSQRAGVRKRLPGHSTYFIRSNQACGLKFNIVFNCAAIFNNWFARYREVYSLRRTKGA